MLGRIARRGVVLVGAWLAVLVVVVVGVPSSAASASDIPWIPPSWTSTSTGSADARSSLLGDNSSFPGQSGWSLTITDAAAPIVFELGDSQRLDLVCKDGTTACANGWGLPSVAISYWAAGTATCVDGTEVSMTVSNGWPSGSGCSSHGGSWTKFVQSRWSDSTHFVSGFILDSGAADGPIYTTDLWCRSLDSGNDTQLTEVGSRGGAAPAPVCQSGSVPIRIRITSSTDGVVQDTSITNWSDWQAYMGTDLPYTVYTPPNSADWGCYLERGPTTFALSVSDCQQSVKDGATGPGGDNNSSDNNDTNIITKAIENATRAITSAINAAKTGIISAIKSVLSGVTRLFVPDQGVMDGLAGDAKSALGSPLSGWESAITSVAGAWAGSGSGCTGPEMLLQWPGGSYTWHPLDACSEPMSTMASLVKAAATVLMITYAVWSAIGAIAAGLGYTPK